MLLTKQTSYKRSLQVYRDQRLNNLTLMKFGYGSYKEFIRRVAVCNCTNKDYLPEAKPRANDHFTCEAKPSKGKMHWP